MRRETMWCFKFEEVVEAKVETENKWMQIADKESDDDTKHFSTSKPNTVRLHQMTEKKTIQIDASILNEYWMLITMLCPPLSVGVQNGERML